MESARDTPDGPTPGGPDGRPEGPVHGGPDGLRGGARPGGPGAARRAEPDDLLDASTDAAAVVTAGGVVVAWTRGAEALLGRPAGEGFTATTRSAVRCTSSTRGSEDSRAPVSGAGRP
ncbi:hypothetical protein ABZ092_39975, partial [Streptomyces bobili]